MQANNDNFIHLFHFLLPLFNYLLVWEIVRQILIWR